MNRVALSGSYLASRMSASSLRSISVLNSGSQPVFARFLSEKAKEPEAEENAKQYTPMYNFSNGNHT